MQVGLENTLEYFQQTSKSGSLPTRLPPADVCQTYRWVMHCFPFFAIHHSCADPCRLLTSGGKKSAFLCSQASSSWQLSVTLCVPGARRPCVTAQLEEHSVLDTCMYFSLVDLYHEQTQKGTGLHHLCSLPLCRVWLSVLFVGTDISIWIYIFCVCLLGMHTQPCCQLDLGTLHFSSPNSTWYFAMYSKHPVC